MRVICLSQFLSGLFLLFPQSATREIRVIEGTVIHSVTGQPIADAQVRIQLAEHEPLFTTTDRQGHYQFTGVDPGTYFVRAHKPGFLGPPNEGPRAWGPGFAAVQVSDARPHAQMQVTLHPGAAISGKALDAAGNPLADAEVRPFRKSTLPQRLRRSPNGQAQMEAVDHVTTNDLGEYRLGLLPAGAYYVQLQPGLALRNDRTYRETYYPRTLDLAAAKPIEVSEGQEIRGLDIQIIQVRGVRVAGRLINAPPPIIDSRPHAYTGVSLVPPDLPPGYVTPFEAVMGDRFEIKDVLPGRYMLEALTRTAGNPLDSRLHTPILWARLAVVVGESDLDGLEVTLAPTVDLAGVVKFAAGCNPETALIRVSSRGRTGGPFEAVTGSGGAFVLAGVVPGEYQLDLMRRTGLPWPVTVRLDGKDVLSGFEVTSTTKGPLEVTMSCAEARGNR